MFSIFFYWYYVLDQGKCCHILVPDSKPIFLVYLILCLSYFLFSLCVLFFIYYFKMHFMRTIFTCSIGLVSISHKVKYLLDIRFSIY